jgi:type III restriction enzyme
VKLHFEPNLDYQHQAIEAACDLFRGQEHCRTEFTVTRDKGDAQAKMAFAENELGIGNRLTLLDDHILENLRAVQLRNGLPPSEKISSGDFTVEMETGTGKTYVYLRTLFELNKRYGFTKFIIVVPSIAIKEGVFHSIKIMAEHFKTIYAGVPFDYFIYDSAKLGQVRNFATSPHMQIMVVTVQSLVRKDHAVVYKDSEKTGGEKPIDLIRSTFPVLVIDEPQSVDGGKEGKGRLALEAMNPICTLRYSATHADKRHMVYRLDAVDAYERKLVKQIEVASGEVQGAHNKPYVRLLRVSSRGGVVSAEVEVDCETASGVKRQNLKVQTGDDLELATGRAIYGNVRIGEIIAAQSKECITLHYPGGEKDLRQGEAHGSVDDSALQRQMIRRTIIEHLEKEKRLAPQGIKVLSLFFVDTVDKYRRYDSAGQQVKGEYALMFEDEYRKLAKLTEYHSLFKDVDTMTEAAKVHDGYFSIDRKGGWVDSDVNADGELTNQSSRDNAERAFTLIMRDKERLLSFETPLKFIFSHSALREGWDNPNVFQICVLREIGTERQRRQTIGRGLRLCVNQSGERVRGFEVNTLTVIATESYEDFAAKLQSEIEEETGIKFGIVEDHHFAGVAVTTSDGKTEPLGFKNSRALWIHLRDSGLIDTKGKVQDALRKQLKEGTLTLPDPFANQLNQIKEILRKLAGRLEIKNADEKKQVKTRQAVLHSADFKALWDRIKHKTTYRVEFDSEALLSNCAEALRQAPPVSTTRLHWRSAELAIGRAGVVAEQTAADAPVILDEADIELPDILTDLQDKTALTRRSIYRILKESGRLNDFLRNPQEFIELADEIINRVKRLALVDGIKYQRIGEEEFYAQELFEKEELTGYLKSMLDANKSVHEQVIYQSDTERTFAEQLEKNQAIKVYAKLPGWFKVPTPLGTYNPDWAILVQDRDSERLYFVIETKSSLFTDDLRDREIAKMKCGKAHFSALAVPNISPALFLQATSVDDVFNKGVHSRH